jgi:hypothetical protein
MLGQWIREFDRRRLGSALASARRAYRMNREGARAGLSGHVTWQLPLDAPNRVAALCDVHGSDKGSRLSSGHVYPWPPHRYCEVYARLFDHCRLTVRKVFECGLGTGDGAFAASMGPKARPGASLLMWRDYFPNARIFGADIDRKVLFQEDRILTFFVDQTAPAMIEEMWRQIGEDDFDLIVDDGLHTAEAAETLFSGSFPKLRAGGIYVVEDMFWGDAVTLRERLCRKGLSPEIVTTASLVSGSLDLDTCLVVIRRP